MKTLLIYLLLSSICTGAFYAAYKIFISKESFYALNRYAILGSILASLLLPLVSFNIISINESSPITDAIYAMNLNEFVVNAAEAQTTKIDSSYLLSSVYLFGVLATLLLTAFSLYKINQLVKRAKQQRSYKGKDLFIHHIKQQGPISWNNKIIISEEDYENYRDEILIHEYAHIQLKHSLDIYLLQFIGIIQWFNPFIWLFKVELQRVHEFQADEYVLQTGINAQKYQLLLIKKSVGNLRFNLANDFSRRDLSKRIKMMVNEKSKSGMKWKYTYLIPLAVAMIFVVGNSKKINAQDFIEAPSVAENLNTIETPAIQQKDTSVFMVVDELPKYPGGSAALMQFLTDNLIYPKAAHEAGIQGRVITSFVIDTDGSIYNIEIKRGQSEELDKAAIDVIKKMPKWIPGKQNGEIVKVKYLLPISFRIPNPKPEATK